MLLRTLCNLCRSNAKLLSCVSSFNQVCNLSGDQSFHSHKEKKFFTSAVTSLLVGSAAVAFGGYAYSKKHQNCVVFAAEQTEDTDFDYCPPVRDDLGIYTRADVAKHTDKSTGIWTTYKNAVYDLTEFVEIHPGGDKVLLAAGTSVDSFWNIYAQHKTAEVAEILEDLRIGTLDPVDAADITNQNISQTASDDPFAKEPKRHPALVANSLKPYNAETPQVLITDHFYTPNDLFFVRNHLPVPEVDGSTHRLIIEGKGLKPMTFSMDDLRHKYKSVTINSAIQCAGNRRQQMSDFKHVNGLTWKGGAIGNAKWKGVRLKDLLIEAGVDPKKQGISHVHFNGLDSDPTGQYYGASIPIEKALGDEVILAYEMNGEPLPRDHGYPLRLIVPGVVGARQVKWLHRIEVSSDESPSHWQQKDYRMFSPSIQWGDHIDYNSAPAIQQAPIQSAICVPINGTKLPKGSKHVDMKGYALSGGGNGIIRVDVSADNGKTWHVAELERDPEQQMDTMWSWTFWSITIPVPEESDGNVTLLCKATDRSYNTQPETPIGIWNVRGLLNNSWHKINVQIPSDS